MGKIRFGTHSFKKMVAGFAASGVGRVAMEFGVTSAVVLATAL